MSHKRSRKIENDKEDMILQNQHVCIGRVKEKGKTRGRGGVRTREEKVLFQDRLLFNYNPLAPSGGQGCE